MQNKTPTLIMTTAALLACVIIIAYTMSQAQPSITMPEGAQQHQPSLGRAEAPLTVYLFENYTCVHCRTFEETVMPQLERDYISTGRVQLVTINLPNSEGATTAAMAGLCAYEQDERAYWTYRTLIYQSAVTTADGLVEIADAQLPGLDADELRSCIDEARRQGDIERNRQLANTAGVSKTPTVVIDNQGFVGTRYAPIQKALERQLRVKP